MQDNVIIIFNVFNNNIKTLNVLYINICIPTFSPIASLNFSFENIE